MNTSSIGPLRLTGAALLVAAALAGNAALAANSASRTIVDNDVDRRVVKYADLNLDTDAGAKALYSRLNVAARQVCHEAEVNSSRELYRFSRFRWCYSSAMDRAVHDVHSPRLLALLEHRRFLAQPWKEDSVASGG
ncbi:MAG TPA: UrcA family protein [Steroidobacteraceae bacterium]|nr:UrcA family protein [Steroidobacteraceae bacterium]